MPDMGGSLLRARDIMGAGRTRQQRFFDFMSRGAMISLQMLREIRAKLSHRRHPTDKWHLQGWRIVRFPAPP